MSESPRILVTAALPYANGPIHLGHLAGAYLPADLYVRYQRLRKRHVLFLCGSDEHGVAITISAEKEHVSPQQIVDRYHAENKAAFERLGISFDNYSRTSLPLHHETSLEFLLNFHQRGILKEKMEKQFFDEKASMFLPDRYVEGTCPVCGNPEARGDQCERCGSFLNSMDLINPVSKISGGTPVVRETSHLYFPLGDFQKRLEEYVEERSKRDGWKENVLNYCQSWFTRGLQDRAITRDLDWGVKIPLRGYEQKVIYVWFDAVLGYISSAKEWADRIGKPDEWRTYWQSPSTKYVAFIGKDNVVFHCIVFPAMIMAWNDGNEARYVLPENVPANEFLNFEGQKFSKSKEWGIYVAEFLDRFPVDPLRYYLAVSLPEYRDADFTWKDFQAKNNNELADILGNFVNRTLAFATRNFDGAVPPRGPLQERDKQILRLLSETPVMVGGHYEHYRFRDAVLETMNLARAANKYFNDSEPWKTVASNRESCATAINISIQLLRSLAILFSPITPFAAQRIWEMLGLDGEVARQAWDSVGELLIPRSHRLSNPDILFTKIDDEVIEKELAALHGTPAGAPAPAAAQQSVPELLTIDDFKRIQLRVGRVLACEKVPKSDKLLKLQVEVGAERRQVLAGIARHYDPESLIGKSVVIVFNLKPAKLMGLASEGMLLAASDDNGNLVILTPAGDISSGSVVR
jgi:methionyl-tRNA synthetase